MENDAVDVVFVDFFLPGAAELLGLHSSTLRAEMRKHGIRIVQVPS